MAANYEKYTLQLNTTTDVDVIAYLESQPSKAGAIKRALRAEMAAGSADE